MWIFYQYKVLKSNDSAESRKFLRMCVDEIRLDPESLEVEINYDLPPMVEDKVVAGGGLEPPTFGL